MFMQMPFTSEVIMLAVGFAIGYWLLITADRNEHRLHRIGEMLAWGLIAATIFFTLCNFLFALSIINKKEYYPVNGPNGPVSQQNPVPNEGESQGPTGPAGPTQQVQTGGGKPVTNTGNNPFGGP